MPKTLDRTILANVPEDKVFCSRDGQTFKNLQELAQGLINMKDETYRLHANRRQNDFAKWVKEVIGDKELGTDLKRTMNRMKASRKVTDRVYYFSSIKWPGAIVAIEHLGILIIFLNDIFTMPGI